MESEIGYEFVPASPSDVAVLRSQVRYTLTHPDGRGRREGYRAAAERGELLLLVHDDRRERQRRLDGFVEFHMRVDDTLTLRDLGTIGDTPHAGVAKHLFSELFNQLGPQSATCVVRRDAEAWNEILASIPGFEVDGPPEYRRPHYYNIWKWSPELARQAQRGGRHRGAPPRGGPGPGRRR
jgi:hypothetical protein